MDFFIVERFTRRTRWSHGGQTVQSGHDRIGAREGRTGQVRAPAVAFRRAREREQDRSDHRLPQSRRPGPYVLFRIASARHGTSAIRVDLPAPVVRLSSRLPDRNVHAHAAIDRSAVADFSRAACYLQHRIGFSHWPDFLTLAPNHSCLESEHVASPTNYRAGDPGTRADFFFPLHGAVPL